MSAGGPGLTLNREFIQIKQMPPPRGKLSHIPRLGGGLWTNRKLTRGSRGGLESAFFRLEGVGQHA
jgi:hypothetical protein